jgi:hypothetical protein
MPLKRKKKESRSLTNVLDALEEEKERVKVTDRRSRCPCRGKRESQGH